MAPEKALFPYDSQHKLVPISALGLAVGRYLWTLRSFLGGRSTFGGSDYFRDGRSWYEWHQLPKDLTADHRTIAYAEVATHNHFILDRTGMVFNRTAPIIKLPAGKTEGDHLELLGVLNSSTVCFWLKQVCFSKGNATVSSGIPDQPWYWNSAFNSTNLAQCPIPAKLPLVRGKRLDRLSTMLQEATPASCAHRVCRRGQVL